MKKSVSHRNIHNYCVFWMALILKVMIKSVLIANPCEICNLIVNCIFDSLIKNCSVLKGYDDREICQISDGCFIICPVKCPRDISKCSLPYAYHMISSA